MQFLSILTRCPNARACLRGDNVHPQLRGTVKFYQAGKSVLVSAEFSGLPIASDPCHKPVFGFHIHEGEHCTGTEADPFSDTGGHFNPSGCPHPYHAGDLSPVFGCQGKAFTVFQTDRFTIRDIIGKTVVLHAMPDDFHTQPSGNSGMKIACGKIFRV